MNEEDIKKWLDSFDNVLMDCDGVLWNREAIPGVKETLQRLSELGKNLYYVSNNGVKSFEVYQKFFKGIGVDINQDHLIHPAVIIPKYLESVGLKGCKIFALASPNLRASLRADGYEVVPAPTDYPEDLRGIIESTKDDLEVSAVVIDMDFHFNYNSMVKAIRILKRPEVQYIVGATEKYLPLEGGPTIPGPGVFQDIVSSTSGRTPVKIAKPSEFLKTAVLKQLKISDPKRSLFVGDMIDHDMEFGTLCGFQKLFVQSGHSTLEDAISSSNPAHKPDFVVKSLGHLILVLPKIDPTITFYVLSESKNDIF